MQFSGNGLEDVLRGQKQDVTVYDTNSFSRGHIQPYHALKLGQSGQYVGVGNARRIRFLRPVNGASTIERLRNASRTTRRIRNDLGVIIAPRPMVEHRSIQDRR